ncbi:MAG: hypothetical protein FJX62_09595 [Alphaproteobacteria bacterium]|nr:hypothetical protein [Alphaproteobacteria bacterium]
MRTASKFIFAAMLAASGVAAASAQPAQTQRVMGQIEKVEGNTLTVKTRQGEMKVNVTGNVAVFGVVKATLADIKKGSFIGVGAMPQPDGSQKAIRVMIFAETQRGTGEGHRPWTQPGSTMTNATVDTTVGSVDGQVVMVKYKDGEKKLVIPPGLPIQQYVVGDRSELKAGAHILIVAAAKKPDGTLEAGRVNVGRDGIVPQ